MSQDVSEHTIHLGSFRSVCCTDEAHFRDNLVQTFYLKNEEVRSRCKLVVVTSKGINQNFFNDLVPILDRVFLCTP